MFSGKNERKKIIDTENFCGRGVYYRAKYFEIKNKGKYSELKKIQQCKYTKRVTLEIRKYNGNTLHSEKESWKEKQTRGGIMLSGKICWRIR